MNLGFPLLEYSNLRKKKFELFQSCFRELQKIPENDLGFRYFEKVSISGMETILEASHELAYFQDWMEECQNIPRVELSSWFQETVEDFSEEFGDEDYRSFLFSNCVANRESILKLLSKFKKEEKNKLKTWNEHLVPANWEESLQVQYVYPNDPKRKPWEGLEPIPQKLTKQIYQKSCFARDLLEDAWPEGFALFLLMTDRIVPVASKGLVSYSFRNQQGISYLNLRDRSLLEISDDLLHETSHHILNLLLKSEQLFHKEFPKDAIYFSPWRQSLRPLYGIFHSVFTSSFCRELFFRMSQNKELIQKWKLDFDFLQERFQEEAISLEYSLTDLLKFSGWTQLGKKLLLELKTSNDVAISTIKTYTQKSQDWKSLLEEKRKLYKIRNVPHSNPARKTPKLN